MNPADSLSIVKHGTWLYSQTVPVRIRILSNPETWGTGDYEDTESIVDNQQIPVSFWRMKQPVPRAIFAICQLTLIHWILLSLLRSRSFQVSSGTVKGQIIRTANKPHASNPAMALLISTLSHRRGVADAELSAA